MNVDIQSLYKSQHFEFTYSDLGVNDTNPIVFPFVSISWFLYNQIIGIVSTPLHLLQFGTFVVAYFVTTVWCKGSFGCKELGVITRMIVRFIPWSYMFGEEVTMILEDDIQIGISHIAPYDYQYCVHILWCLSLGIVIPESPFNF